MKANQKIQSVELPTPGKELHILMLNNFVFFCFFLYICKCFHRLVYLSLFLSHLCTHSPTTTTTLCVFIRLFRVSRSHCFSATKDQAKENEEDTNEILHLMRRTRSSAIEYCSSLFQN